MLEHLWGPQMERTLLPKARLPSLGCVTSHGFSLWFKTAGVSPPPPPAWPGLGNTCILMGSPRTAPHPPRELRRDKPPEKGAGRLPTSEVHDII